MFIGKIRFIILPVLVLITLLLFLCKIVLKIWNIVISATFRQHNFQEEGQRWRTENSYGWHSAGIDNILMKITKIIKFTLPPRCYKKHMGFFDLVP